MSYEEMEYLNRLTAKRREQACRRERMTDMAIRWGGWLLAALVLAANIVAVVH